MKPLHLVGPAAHYCRAAVARMSNWHYQRLIGRIINKFLIDQNMRPLLVLLFALAIFGALAAYERFVDTLPQRNHAAEEAPAAAGKFSLELTLSFDAAKDDFALEDEPAAVVRMAGQDLIRADQPVTAGQPLRADDLSGIVSGRNAFFVRAAPAQDFISRPCAARLRIFRDDAVIGENTLWSPPGGLVEGEVVVEVE